jgi:hypothetical protein
MVSNGFCFTFNLFLFVSHFASQMLPRSAPRHYHNVVAVDEAHRAQLLEEQKKQSHIGKLMNDLEDVLYTHHDDDGKLWPHYAVSVSPRGQENRETLWYCVVRGASLREALARHDKEVAKGQQYSKMDIILVPLPEDGSVYEFQSWIMLEYFDIHGVRSPIQEIQRDAALRGGGDTRPIFPPRYAADDPLFRPSDEPPPKWSLARLPDAVELWKKLLERWRAAGDYLPRCPCERSHVIKQHVLCCRRDGNRPPLDPNRKQDIYVGSPWFGIADPQSHIRSATGALWKTEITGDDTIEMCEQLWNVCVSLPAELYFNVLSAVRVGGVWSVSYSTCIGSYITIALRGGISHLSQEMIWNEKPDQMLLVCGVFQRHTTVSDLTYVR